MGTTVSSLQILGAEEDAVRAALPKAAVAGQPGGLVTACPENLAFTALNRRAGLLSQKLCCTVLAVSMFDGDMLDLSLYQNGRRLTRHVVDPETETCISGNPRLFCGALGLPPETAPKLKRLFTCFSQEEKLDILAQVLGAPLMARWDQPETLQAVEADPGALENWIREHPLPPKLRNQGKAELIQEVPGVALDYQTEGDAIILRPVVRAGEEGVPFLSGRAGEIVGNEGCGGFWGLPGPDGTLQLTPLEEDDLRRQLSGLELSGLEYAQLDGRLVTYSSTMVPDPGFPGAYCPAQTVILKDSAGRLPVPLPLTLDHEPACAALRLLPDGGFLAKISEKEDLTVRPRKVVRPAALACCGPEGNIRWVRTNDRGYVVHVDERGIYTRAYPSKDAPARVVLLDLDGQETAEYRLPSTLNRETFCILGGKLYLLLDGGYEKNGTLHRLTPDLEENGGLPVPYMSSFALSPDGSLLYAAGFQSGLAVMDAAAFQVRGELRRRESFHSPIADGQNRLWVGNGGYVECYTPELELISRHRLAGEISRVWPGPEGSVCAMTYQRSKGHVRVYRLG